MGTVLHVTTETAWDAARTDGAYAPPDLARDGFLHCCTEDQLAFVLARHFAGRTGLVVLEVDAQAAGAPLEWVASEPDQAPFPHLRGPIPAGAVRGVRSVG